MKKHVYSFNKYEVEEFNDFLTIKSYVVNIGKNNNMTYFERDSIVKAIPTFSDKPTYGKWKMYEEDFGDHENKGEEGYIKDCTFLGHIPSNSDIQFEEYKGKTYLTVTSVVYKSYFPTLAQFIIDNKPSISMEIYSFEEEEMPNGYLNIKDWTFQSFTFLGKNVRPAIENAHSEAINFSEDEEKKKVFKMFSDKYEEVKKHDKECFKLPKQLYEKIKNRYNINKLEVDNGFLEAILEKSNTLSFSEIVSLLNKATNAKSKEERDFYGGEEIVNWCRKTIGFNEGGGENLKNKEEQIKNKDVNNEGQGEGNEKDNFSISNRVNLCIQVLEEQNYWYEDMDDEGKNCYVYAFGEGYLKIPFTMQNEVPVFNYEDKKKVYRGGINWVEEKPEEDKITYQLEPKVLEKTEESFTLITKFNEEIEDLKGNIENLESEKQVLQEEKVVLEEENKELQEYKDSKEEEELLNKAEGSIEEYSQFLSQEQQESLKEFIKEEKDFNKFTAKLNSLVVKGMAEMLKIQQAEENKTKDNFSINKIDDKGEDFNDIVNKGKENKSNGVLDSEESKELFKN